MRLHLPLRMNMTPRLSIALVCAAALTGCANMSESERGAAQGAAIGAVAGAILSSATGGSAGTGAVMGGAAGAVGGHLWSQRMQDKQRAMEQATRGSGVQVTRTADDQLKLQVPSDISFAVGSATLEPRLRPVLDAFASGLDRDPQMLVRVVATNTTAEDRARNRRVEIFLRDTQRSGY